MTDEISILSIEVFNYRQYSGKQIVEFYRRDEGFTTVVGENGKGKSNLLNAITWCFYHYEPHGKKDSSGKPVNSSAPIVNEDALKKAGEEKTVEVYVRVVLQYGDEYYQIYRHDTILVHKLEYEKTEGGLDIMKYKEFETEEKIPAGCERIPNMSGFTIERKEKDQLDFHEIKTQQHDDVIATILPRTLCEFFLLDGEFLEKFWDNFEKVETGIKQILQLWVLAEAEKHVGLMNTRRISLNDGSEEDQLQKKIQRNERYEKSLNDDGLERFSENPRWSQEGEEESDEQYHATGLTRITDFEHDMTKMRKRQTAITADLGNVSASSTKSLQEEFRRVNGEWETAKEAKSDLETKWRDNLVEEAPFAFLKNAIQKSVEIIEERKKRGELPNETKQIFTNDLLERGFCICSADLKSKKTGGKETNNSRIEVTKERDRVSLEVGLDVALKMRISFKDKILDDYDTFLRTTFGDPKSIFRKAEKAEEALNIEVKKIKTQLGDTGDDRIKGLINENAIITEQIRTAQEKIDQEKRQLDKNGDDTYAWKQKLSKTVLKNARAKKSYHEMQIWDKATQLLKKAHEELKKEIRTNIQKKTWEIFRQIYRSSTDEIAAEGGIQKDERFTAFEIQSDYSVILQTNKQQNHISNLSAGQSLFLAISFVTALRTITGYTFPFIIDTPLGKVSGTQRYNLATTLPTYLKGEQLSFLATDTEWIGEIPNITDTPRPEGSMVDHILAKGVDVKHYRIVGDSDGRSRIESVKYEKKKGRGVLTVVK